MHNKKKFIVSSFYKFVHVTEPDTMKILLERKLTKYDVKGTFIIGNEGINGSFSSIRNNVSKICKIIESLIRTKLKFKLQETDCHTFLRLKIKLKKEIVTMGKKNIDPKNNSGERLDPESWEKLIEMKDSIIIDTRNEYESDVGSFSSSIETKTKNFRDFPKWIKKNRQKLKNKKIGMFCTGGIRCEKASNYLINLGYENVYQLEGGIIEYLKETKNKKKMWHGECFVFDERITINEKLEKGSYHQCFACRSAVTDEEKDSKYFKPGVSCPKCYKQTSPKQKARYQERQKQILIAKQKGIKHLGD